METLIYYIGRIICGVSSTSFVSVYSFHFHPTQWDGRTTKGRFPLEGPLGPGGLLEAIVGGLGGPFGGKGVVCAWDLGGGADASGGRMLEEEGPGFRSLLTWGSAAAGGGGAARGWWVVRRMEEARRVATDTLRPESATERRAVAVLARARLYVRPSRELSGQKGARRSLQGDGGRGSPGVAEQHRQHHDHSQHQQHHHHKGHH